MLVRYGFDYQSTLGNTVLVEALSPNGTALFSKIDTLAPTGVYVSKEYIISLDALSNVEFRITPQNSNLTYIDNKRLNLFNGGANLFTNGDFNSNISGWTIIPNSGFGNNTPLFSNLLPFETPNNISSDAKNLKNSGSLLLPNYKNRPSSPTAAQSITLTNGNTYFIEYDFSFFSDGDDSNNQFIVSSGMLYFGISTTSNMNTLVDIEPNIRYFTDTSMPFCGAMPVWKKARYSFVFNGTTGAYFVGFKYPRSTVSIDGYNRFCLIDNVFFKTGSFSTANLFSNGDFATNGNGWDYNNSVWAWDGGAMKFEII